MIIMNYVDRIVALRQDKDLKQSEVAAVLNKSRSAYANLENKRYRFTVEDIIKLCEFYNVSPEYLLCFSDNPSPLDKVK